LLVWGGGCFWGWGFGGLGAMIGGLDVAPSYPLLIVFPLDGKRDVCGAYTIIYIRFLVLSSGNYFFCTKFLRYISILAYDLIQSFQKA
jgi:hypothetical protein